MEFSSDCEDQQQKEQVQSNEGIKGVTTFKVK